MRLLCEGFGRTQHSASACLPRIIDSLFEKRVLCPCRRPTWRSRVNVDPLISPPLSGSRLRVFDRLQSEQRDLIMSVRIGEDLLGV